MKINSFEITNLIFAGKQYCKVKDKNGSATLSLTNEKPAFSVYWGHKLLVDDYFKPFGINHPIFKNYTFKLTNYHINKQQVSLLEMLRKTFNMSLTS
jgi:hypothetical protein